MSVYALSSKFQKEIRAGARAMKKKIANHKRQERAKRIVSKKLAVILRRKIREAKKQQQKPVKVVKQYRPRRTKAEIQIAVMKKELDRRANFEKKFAEKFGLSKSALRQCRRAALA